MIKDRASKADPLIAAITELKAKLTTDQLQQLGSLALVPPPIPPAWSGAEPGPFGPGLIPDGIMEGPGFPGEIGGTGYPALSVPSSGGSIDAGDNPSP